MANKKRLHFGVLCSTIDNACQYDIWKGIVEEAKEQDIHLTAYIGTHQHSDNSFVSYLESCFDTIWNSKHLDGVIILSGFLAQNIGLDEFNEYIARVPKNIPMVSVSFALPGIPSVVTDNTSGMFSAVNHLIKIHNKKNIAFVKGPDGHPEAEARLKGYKDALEANGISFNEKYVFPGNFGRDGGRRAVTEMYDERKLTVDAVACSNDQTAIGVLTILQNKNIMVPENMAVTGFDDDIISSIYVPSISTVRQDFAELGRVSTNILIDITKGKNVEEITNVNPVFIARQSCGCTLKEFSFSEKIFDETIVTNDSLTKYVQEQLHGLFDDDVPKSQVEEWAKAIIKTLRAKPFEKSELLYIIDRILVKYYHSYSKEFSKWHQAIIIIASGVELHKDEFEDAHSILAALTFATTLVHDIRLNEEKKREYALNDDRTRKMRITNELLIMFDIDTLAEKLYKSLKDLFLDSALIGLYHSPVNREDRDANRTIETLIGFDGEDRFNVTHNSWNPMKFSDYSTIEDYDFDREHRILVFMPLFFAEEEVGVMLLPYSETTPIDAYETLRINLSTAIKGAALLQTIQTLSITDELTELLNRRGFFQFSYSRLQHLNRSPGVIPIVMFIDMDGLKSINDQYGHKEGDFAIAKFSEILKEAIREEDIVGRIGGDEFAILSSVKAMANSKQLEERIRARFDEYNSKNLHPFIIAGSIGSVTLEYSTKECFEAAMLSADSVLYAEKMEKKKKGLSRQ
ncbi:MAG: GGDEF domain-containing protein [Oscillospiraceae bacterium]|jgi:diguanylate cyclase (GGDEF)-like protein|nr:GGDEF domain-containing protein [Oscillospiraceae bacterium]